MPKLHHQIIREEQARDEVGSTAIRPPVALALSLGFLGLIFAVPLIQLSVWAVSSREGPPTPGTVHNVMPSFPWRSIGATLDAQVHPLRRLIDFNRTLLRHLHAWEDDLEDASILGRKVRPRLQYRFATRLGVGSEKVYVGRKEALFYRPDLVSVTGPGFLDPSQLRRRALSGDAWERPPCPDPRPAIREFHRTLSARGIELVLLPVPVKPTVAPERFALRSVPAFPRNRDFARLVRELEADGIHVFDVLDVLAAADPPERGWYLAHDTHWRPETLRKVAEGLASQLLEQVDLPVLPEPMTFHRRQWVASASGDLADMLDLPSDRQTFQPETVSIEQGVDGEGNFLRSDPKADVLLLGDSFSNIFSFAPLGWGEAAGFAEHLSMALRRPVDRIVRNDAGAYATRAMLASALARGTDRLAGKRVVVWQFSERELALGDWRRITLTSAVNPPVGFISIDPGHKLWVQGVVREVAPTPRPGTVPYRDHVTAVHLAALEYDDAAVVGSQALVYLLSMRDNQWTPAARLQPGDTVTVELRDWSDMAAHKAGLNRTELDRAELQLVSPCWGAFPDAPQPGPTPDVAGVMPAVTPHDPLTERVAQTGMSDRQVVVGRDGWLFFAPEIRHVSAGPFWGEAAQKVSRAARAEAADPMPAILDFHHALSARGVALVLVPVPPKAVIYPDRLPGELASDRLDTVHARFYEQLRAEGVTVLDLTQRFLEKRDPPEGPLYCREDSHWSGVGSVVAAQSIADAVRPLLSPPASGGTMFASAWQTLTLKGDLARLLPVLPEPPEQLKVRKIWRKAGSDRRPVGIDPSSPVLLLGDSHALVFHAGEDLHARNAGLPDQLAYELGLAIDLVAVRGSGATPARINLFRRAQREPGFWDRKSVVIWCFAAREFTESDGWRIVPIEP